MRELFSLLLLLPCCLGCGDYLFAQNGYITSPNYPSDYPNDAKCEWRITVCHSHRIVFSFTDIDIWDSNDNVEVYNGMTDSNPLLGRFTGRIIPASVTSSGNQMLIRFSSDSVFSKVGFSSTFFAEDVCTDDECRYCQNGGSCLFENNNFVCVCLFPYMGLVCDEKDYCSSSPCQNGGNCSNLHNGFKCDCIDGYNGTECKINIDDCAAMPCQNGGECIDGINKYSCNCVPPFYGANCTDITPCPASQCSNHGICGYIGVISFLCICDPGYYGSSCEMDFDECASSPCVNGGFCIDGINSYKCNCTFPFNGTRCEECGQILYAQNGSFTSPGYPSFYPSNTFCKWHISVNVGYVVLLTFTTFDTEFTNGCQKDKVLVVDTADENGVAKSRIIGKYCGNSLPAPDISSMNKLSVRMYSDNTTNASGFLVSYTSVALPVIQECGGNITGKNGTITSPFYPSHYPNNMLCSWLISVCPARTIVFSFTDLDTFPDFDTISVYDDTTGIQLGTYSGSLPSTSVSSTSNKMLIRFSSDEKVRKRGFAAKYRVDSASCTDDWCRSGHGYCQNGGTCVDRESGFSCSCAVNYTGEFCSETDNCAYQPCKNGGTCTNNAIGFSCQCTQGFNGTQCEEKRYSSNRGPLPLYCPCRSCSAKQKENVNFEEIMNEMMNYKKNLTSKTRKLTSAPDDRLSAKVIGANGLIIILFLFSVIVVLDIPNILKMLKRNLHAD